MNMKANRVAYITGQPELKSVISYPRSFPNLSHLQGHVEAILSGYSFGLGLRCSLFLSLVSIALFNLELIVDIPSTDR